MANIWKEAMLAGEVRRAQDAELQQQRELKAFYRRMRDAQRWVHHTLPMLIDAAAWAGYHTVIVQHNELSKFVAIEAAHCGITVIPDSNYDRIELASLPED